MSRLNGYNAGYRNVNRRRQTWISEWFPLPARGPGLGTRPDGGFRSEASPDFTDV